MKSVEEHTYNLLSLISLFSHGVLICDLAHIGRILNVSNKSWIQFIIRLSLATDINDFSSLEIDMNLASKITTNCDMHEILTIFMETNNLNNTWIELKRERIGKREEIRIKTDHDLRKILSEYFEEDVHIFWCWMQPLTYLKQFYSSVILKNINSHIYVEDLIENTEVNSSSVWSAHLKSPPQNYCYFLEEDGNLSEVKDLVRFHNVSMKSFLSEEEGTFSFKKSLDTITKFMEDVELTYLGVLEDLLMKLLTVCKIYMDYEEGLEYTQYIRRLYDTKILREKFKKLEMMVELYEADILFRMMGRPKVHKLIAGEKNLYSQLNVIDQLTETFQFEEGYIFRGEYLITKYCIINSLHKEFKSEIDKKDLEKQELEKCVKLMQQLRDSIDTSKEVSKFVWAKLNYLVANYKYIHTELEYKDFKELNASAKIFESYNSPKLLSKSLYLLGLLHLNKAESCLKYCKTALEIAEIVGEEKLIKDLKFLINESNKRLRYRYQNKLMFLTSNPMNSVHYQTKHCGLNLSKNLREYLNDTLINSGKNILVHFDVLTKNIMYELFTKNQGCKLLVIDNCYDNKKGIVAEGGDFKEEIFSFSTLDKMSKDDAHVKINIDVLVLLSDNPIKLAKYSRSKGIPVVIYFKFKNDPSSFTDILTTFLQKEIKYLFLKNFVSYCLRNFKIEDAFLNAKTDTVEELSDVLIRNYEYLEVDMKKLNSLKNSSGRNFSEIPLPNIENLIEESLFMEKDSKVKVKFELKDGKLEDTSAVVGARLSLFNFVEPYMLRNKEIVDLYTKVKRFKWVNLYSEKGLGKTHFLKQFRNELLLRNCYPDGVFIFDMKEVKNYSPNRNIKDLIKVEFGQRFDQNMDEFFEKKKMLIILDDFGLVCHHKEIRYPTYFLRALEKHKITTLFITHKEMKETDIIQNLDHFKLSGFDWKQSLIMFLSLQRHLFIKFKNFDENYLKGDPCFRHSHGSPKLIRKYRFDFLVKCLKIEGACIGKNFELLQGILEDHDLNETQIHIPHNENHHEIKMENILSENETTIPVQIGNSNALDSFELLQTNNSRKESRETNGSFDLLKIEREPYKEEKIVEFSSGTKEIYDSEYEDEKDLEEEASIFDSHQIQTEILGKINHPLLKPIEDLSEEQEILDSLNQEEETDDKNDQESEAKNELSEEPEIGNFNFRLSETRTVNSYNPNSQSLNTLSDQRRSNNEIKESQYLKNLAKSSTINTEVHEEGKKTLGKSHTMMTDGMGYGDNNSDIESESEFLEVSKVSHKRQHKIGSRQQRYKNIRKKKSKYLKVKKQKEKERKREQR